MRPGVNNFQAYGSIWGEALTFGDQSSKSKGRLKKSEIIHHPEFEEAIIYLDDPYWISIFKSCARKKFPKGFFYNDRHLNYRPNDVTMVLPDDAQNVAATAVFFFRENGRLHSERDQIIQQRFVEQAISEQMANSPITWTKVSRSKNKRSLYIRGYVDRKYADLPLKIRDELYTQINLGLETKRLTGNQITFVNGIITQIDGIDANEKGVIHSRAMPTRRTTTSSKVVPTTKPKHYEHEKNWDKFLQSYSKHIVASAQSSHTLQTVTCTGDGQGDDEIIIITI
jgi:hypothetical protein